MTTLAPPGGLLPRTEGWDPRGSTGVLGPGPFVEAARRPVLAAQLEIDGVVGRLKALHEGDTGMLLLEQAGPTAAFSRRDTLLPGYGRAREAVVDLGLAPVVRPVGGHLAAYDGGSLVLHLWGPHSRAREDIQARFALLGATIAAALRGLGVDARVGAVPGEYCDGKYSVNAAGRVKLAGTGQRIAGRGFLFSAVVMVHASAAVREALCAAYALLDLELDPRSVGGVSDAVPGVTLDDVRGGLIDALSEVLPGLVRDDREAATPGPTL